MVSTRKPKAVLRFDQPAGWWGAVWREALPAGNGLVGASVFGKVEKETIMLSHAGLNWQGHIGVLPEVSEKVKEVRKSVLDGKLKDAQDILPNALISKNYRPITSVPLPLCDFIVKMQPEKAVKDYMRVVNMDAGEVSVCYKDGATRYDRSLFVSRANDCVVYEITRTGSAMIDAEFSFEMHDLNNIRTTTAFSKKPDGLMRKVEPYYLYYSARNDNGTDFGAVAKITYFGGSQEVTENSIRIKGASDILVVIHVFAESQREKEWKAAKALLAANKMTYDKMLKESMSLHSKLMHTAEIDLESSERETSVEELIAKANKGEITTALLEKLWYFGRYLLVCSSRENGQMTSPYGLWCGDYKAYGAANRTDGLLQLMYSMALCGNLPEYLQAVFSYYEGALPDLKKNAFRLYGCKGIFVPTVTSPGTGLIGSVEPEVVHYTAGAGWIANLFYLYYLYTGDKKFLKERAIPFMKEAALFYEDFLKLDMSGKYVTCPSYSPNNTPANLIDEKTGAKTAIAYNSTIDFAVCKELLCNLIEASEELKVNKEEVPKWKDMLTKMPEYAFNPDGSLKEYLPKELEDNDVSRYASHLYPAFPGLEVFDEATELGKGCLLSAKKRVTGDLSDMTSWAYGYYATLFSRLGDATLANDCLTAALRSTLMNNLVTAENDWRGMGLTSDFFWAPYQIAGNLSITQAIHSFFAVSDKNTIRILPALPESVDSFTVESFCLPCGVNVDIECNRKRGILNVTMKAKSAKTVTLILPEMVKAVKKGPSTKLENRRIEGVALPGGKAVKFDFRI
ncbi:MAG: glycoside hydrolase N-terminal domain-containing protein [Clostridia bacterium]|nr:glycoside hydrolase N-terminal domain-containing protein [Clostridia bacterium]